MLPYNDYGSWIRRRLGRRIQKLPVNAGFSCPNRDGRYSRNGCTYCDNSSFTPSYCDATSSITHQLEAGKRFFSHKYPDMGYLAYFQSYTNTYADLATLQSRYEEALRVDGILGLVVSTRPDCLPLDVLGYLEELNHRTFLTVELGIESTNDSTLALLNRQHDFSCSRAAVDELSSRGIFTCGHVILGLPGDNRQTIVGNAHAINELPLSILKIHQLQVLRGTQLGHDYLEGNISVVDKEAYMELLALYICHLRGDLVLERFFSSSPLHRVLAPKWGERPERLQQQLCSLLIERGWHQGKYAEQKSCNLSGYLENFE